MRFIIGLISILILTIIPLPYNLSSFRPSWVLLFILLIEFYYPHYFRLLGVILLGLIVDSILFSPLGLHAFSFVITTWFAMSQVGRFKILAQEQQLLLIGLFCLVNECSIYLVNLFLGFEQTFWPLLIKCFLGVLLFPILKRFLVYSPSFYNSRVQIHF